MNLTAQGSGCVSPRRRPASLDGRGADGASRGGGEHVLVPGCVWWAFGPGARGLEAAAVRNGGWRQKRQRGKGGGRDPWPLPQGIYHHSGPIPVHVPTLRAGGGRPSTSGGLGGDAGVEYEKSLTQFGKALTPAHAIPGRRSRQNWEPFTRFHVQRQGGAGGGGGGSGGGGPSLDDGSSHSLPLSYGRQLSTTRPISSGGGSVQGRRSAARPATSSGSGGDAAGAAAATAEDHRAFTRPSMEPRRSRSELGYHREGLRYTSGGDFGYGVGLDVSAGAVPRTILRGTDTAAGRGAKI